MILAMTRSNEFASHREPAIDFPGSLVVSVVRAHTDASLFCPHAHCDTIDIDIATAQCFVCAPTPQVQLVINTAKATVGFLTTVVLQQRLGLIAPDVSVDGTGSVWVHGAVGRGGLRPENYLMLVPRPYREDLCDFTQLDIYVSGADVVPSPSPPVTILLNCFCPSRDAVGLQR